MIIKTHMYVTHYLNLLNKSFKVLKKIILKTVCHSYLIFHFCLEQQGKYKLFNL